MKEIASVRNAVQTEALVVSVFKNLNERNLIYFENHIGIRFIIIINQ